MVYIDTEGRNDMDFIKGLNDKQKEAVCYGDGPLLILAGAGSGKTRVLTHRIAYLIEERGVFPGNILAITFTNKAANEMKERVGKLLHGKAEDIWMGTFHSICVRILRMFIDRLGYDRNFIIYDADDQKTLLKECIKEKKLNKDTYKEKSIISIISSQKSLMVDPDTYINENYGDFYCRNVGEIYALYQERLKKNNALDFDDLILKTIELLKKDKDALEYCQKKFKYIFVDEYQDTNKAQYVLIRLLSGKYKNVCVVGDDDQCVLEGSKVTTAKGNIPIEDLKENDKVYSASGKGEILEGTIDKIMRKEYQGPIIKIKTKSGKIIKTTPNHIMFGKLNPEPGIYYIYLMYRVDKGYRIGMTQGVRSRKGEVVNGLMVRINQEHGDKIWILKTCESKEEAIYYEQLFSVKYQIPTCCYHAIGRNLTMGQEYIDRIFEEIDTRSNVVKLMDDLLLFEEYPHYRPNAVIRGQSIRRIVNLSFFSGRKSGIGSGWYSHRIGFNTSGEDLKESFIDMKIPVRDGNRETWRVETERVDYDETVEYAKKLEVLDESIEVVERARLTEDDYFSYMPASHIRENMSIPVYEDGKIVEDIVDETSVEEYRGFVYDISVPNFRQYICEGIVVHNSIYGWRGADIRNILDFEKDFPNTKVIKLEQNYRSTKNILDVANSIIKNNHERKDKKLWTTNGEGTPTTIYTAFDEMDEGNFVADKIRSLVDTGEYNLSDFAILYRTNAQSRAFEEVFMRKDIPYKIVGGLKFYARKEVKDVIAYLRLIQNPADDVSLRRIINIPKRGIGLSTIEKIEKYIAQTGESIYSALLGVEDIPGLSQKAITNIKSFTEMINKFIAMKEVMELKDFIEEVVYSTGYIKELEEEDSIEATSRIENIKEFISVAVDYETSSEEATLEDFLATVSLLSDVDKTEENGDAVTLMTVHSAKGLEYPVVFVVGMEEGLFPIRRALDGGSDELEEERRLCYVAVTRAQKLLYITFATVRTIYGNTSYSIPSSFLKEIPEELVMKDDKKGKFTAEPKKQKWRGEDQRVVVKEYKKENTILKKILENRDVERDKKNKFIENKSKIQIGSKVKHKMWGVGTVVQLKEKEGDMEILVAFPEKGLKKLLLSVAPVEVI